MEPQALGDEMVQTAIQMEELGRDFYEALGAATSNPEIAGLCRKLAAEEGEHRRTFQRIRSDLAREGLTVLLGNDQLARARQAAKERIVPDRATIVRVVSAGGVIDLLEMAVEMEKDAIRFYTGLAAGLSQEGAIGAVIQEEQKHLRILSAIRDRERESR